MAAEATSEAMLAHMKSDFGRVPMRRMLTPEEIAGAVSFLTSGSASGITGIDLVVDGGTLANLYILETLPQE
jgi:NAD(P)-dependent dehydrogenase (short-subunit alcohol dehydrogenase family)